LSDLGHVPGGFDGKRIALVYHFEHDVAGLIARVVKHVHDRHNRQRIDWGCLLVTSA
jgi:hypothetical protein